MRTIFFLTLGALLLGACASEPTSEDYEKDLKEKIQTFKKKESGNLQDFTDLLARIRSKMARDSYGGEKKGDGITLNFETNSNAFQYNYNYWADTSSLGVQNKYYMDQVNLHNLLRAIELPIDSFKPQYDAKGRCRGFDALTKDIGGKMSNADYIVGVYTRSNVQPIWLGAVYEPGKYKGMVMIYNVESEELVASVEFEAVSSSTITAEDFGDLGDAAISDFSNHVYQAYVKALSDNFKVIGKPSSIKATAGY